MEQYLHQAQLGFIREGECPMHILGAIQDIILVKENYTNYKTAGFLFIDFQQAFDSVNHKILLKKLETFPNNNPKWN